MFKHDTNANLSTAQLDKEMVESECIQVRQEAKENEVSHLSCLLACALRASFASPRSGGFCLPTQYWFASSSFRPFATLPQQTAKYPRTGLDRS